MILRYGSEFLMIKNLMMREKRKGKKNFSLIHFEKCHFILHELSNVLDTMNSTIYIYVSIMLDFTKHCRRILLK